MGLSGFHSTGLGLPRAPLAAAPARTRPLQALGDHIVVLHVQGCALRSICRPWLALAAQDHNTSDRVRKLLMFSALRSVLDLISESLREKVAISAHVLSAAVGARPDLRTAHSATAPWPLPSRVGVDARDKEAAFGRSLMTPPDILTYWGGMQRRASSRARGGHTHLRSLQFRASSPAGYPRHVSWCRPVSLVLRL